MEFIVEDKTVITESSTGGSDSKARKHTGRLQGNDTGEEREAGEMGCSRSFLRKRFDQHRMGKLGRIRELASELHRANQQLEVCREQLSTVMTYIEEHTKCLSKTVEEEVHDIKEV
ncbi:protein FAR1-RELATED SEQUENCE 5-like isoform X2 [Melia azedarach]|uniref:Protein FAR1-RELATED SEQUENCE 5-like isoform X2 n=1 Tax=Melia azedarach TaxID=155640 RepID=A0ACC1XH34_MELAZ|nr:protein FAR1-RELATED SEQUENCE 5-like isoform X2 [Melia azedarach]